MVDLQGDTYAERPSRTLRHMVWPVFSTLNAKGINRKKPNKIGIKWRTLNQRREIFTHTA